MDNVSIHECPLEGCTKTTEVPLEGGTIPGWWLAGNRIFCSLEHAFKFRAAEAQRRWNKAYMELAHAQRDLRCVTIDLAKWEARQEGKTGGT